MNPRLRRALAIAGGLALAAPGLYQLALLAIAVAGRLCYPFDLEWMEGGMLHHALRIQTGHGIYTPPSIDFIPYLYTPLYPALLAALGSVFGLTYTLARAISMLSLIGIAVVATVSITRGFPTRRRAKSEVSTRGPAWIGVALALGLFAAIYPYVEGWYDLARADTLFLFLVTAGIAALPRWAATGGGIGGHARVAAGAAILALAFYTKQTGIFYVGLGGAIVAVVRWRRLAIYIAVAGVLGLGGCALMNAITNGWFWVYVSQIHRAHDFNMDRFWKSYSYILWHFPALTIVVAVGLLVVFVTWLRTRSLPRQAQPLLLWSAAFAVSTVVGAVGWGTQFAHFNAYMPAFLHGALAAGAALPAIAACTRALAGDRFVVPSVTVVAAALGLTLIHARWSPRAFIPTDADVAAGNKLIVRLAALPGDVWMPSHPWYLVLAGKTPHVHHMGITDVTTGQSRQVIGLDDALSTRRFSAIVFDNNDLFVQLPQLHRYYHPEIRIPPDERPRVFGGARVAPDSIWVPAIPTSPPTGARVVFDFEGTSWAGWTRSGPAWGDGPVDEPVKGQDLVLGATGQRFATSMHGGDLATGRMTSPAFTIDGARITMKLGGGSDTTKLRVELWVNGAIARTASVPLPASDKLRDVTWDVAELSGKLATLVLVDDATAAGGHLDVDDVWIWDNP